MNESEKMPAVVQAKCCKTCAAFDNPSLGHGRCMKRPTSKSRDYNAAYLIVEACNICEWHEGLPGSNQHQQPT